MDGPSLRPRPNRAGPRAPMFRYGLPIDRNEALHRVSQSGLGAEQVANARCILGVVARDLAQEMLRLKRIAQPRTRS